MKNIKSYLALLCVFPFFSCRVIDARLKLTNGLSYDIVAEGFSDTIPDVKETYSTNYYLINIAKPKQVVILGKEGKSRAWDKVIERSKNNKLNVCVFSADSLKKYGDLDSLIRKKLYKRFEYSMEDLEKNDWEIIVH